MNTDDNVEILLVEDNPHDVELTLRALTKNKIINKVLVATDGAQALDFIFCAGVYKDRDMKNPPKVILLDLKLPKVSGIEVLRKIKSDERTKAIPVVVLTSSEQERDVAESYGLGVNSYIVKPVDFEKFIKVVGEIGLYWLLTNRPPVI